MQETAEGYYHTITSSRSCTIEITNASTKYWLTNPKVYMEKGFSFSPPQPTVYSNKTEVCSFIKDDGTVTGAVGVLTYQLFSLTNHSHNMMMAVMFSVPFDYNLYKNMLGVGFFDPSCATDEALYDKMYKKEPSGAFTRHEADGSGITFSKNKVDVRATMSNEGKAVIKLELFDEM